MATIDETAYPRLKPDPSAQELDEVYTPSDEERAFAARVARSPLARLGVLLHLKLCQRLGYFPSLETVPPFLVRHVARTVGVQRSDALVHLQRYDRSVTSRQHRGQVRDYLRLRVLDPPGRSWLLGVAQTAAQTKPRLEDIINAMLEELVHQRYELPAFSTLERIAFQGREAVHKRVFDQLNGALTPAQRSQIDALFVARGGERTTPWQGLKREIRKPTHQEVRSYLQHVQYLKGLCESLPPVDGVAQPLLRRLRQIARASDASEMAEFKPAKRYALAIIFLRAQHARTLDDAGELFLKLMQQLENNARQRLLEHQLAQAERVDRLIDRFKQVLEAWDPDEGPDAQLARVQVAIGEDRSPLLAECEEHLAYAQKNFLPFLLFRYASLRPLLFNCLEIMEVQASSQDARLVRLVTLMLTQLRHWKRDTVALVDLGVDLIPDLDWLPIAWRRQLFKSDRIPDGLHFTNRKFFELAVLFQVRNELRSGDLFIPNGDRFDDYREHLIDDATFERERAAYGEVAGVEVDTATFVGTLRRLLSEKAEAVDARFKDNLHAEMKDGQLSLKRMARPEVSQAIGAVDEAITARMTPTGIVDVLLDGVRWLGLEKHFQPLAGTESRLEDHVGRVVATLFCYGCNLGPVQTARSLRNFSRRQVAWLNLKYVTEEGLEAANTDVVNAYNRFELPRYWGSGEHVAADGTKWDVYDQNLLSENHIRYGGYGGIGYYHVSDTYIALCSRFQTCGVYEAIYIFDGLLANESDIQPKFIHGDTQAQSYPVFALALLLGFELMPRIRKIKDLTFFRAEPEQRFQALQPLFREAIDWDLITTHYQDMLRMVVSIRLGKITASTILRRLGTYSRKNKLYFAFRELGRVVRTVFLLDYIDSLELRQMVHSATNKCEEFNGFLKWSFFGSEGIIAENIQHEQRKVVKYNQLVANLIILHNVSGMTQVLHELQREGLALDKDVLAGLSPYRTSHINRFGDYTLDLGRSSPPPDYDAPALLPQPESAG